MPSVLLGAVQQTSASGTSASLRLETTAIDLEQELATALARRDFQMAQLKASPITASSTLDQRARHNMFANNVASMDARVRELQAGLAQARAEIAQMDAAAKQGNAPVLAGSPVAQTSSGSSVPPQPPGMGKNETIIAGFFTIFVLGPLAIALAIRIVRRGWSGSAVNTREVTEMADRVRRIENAVETMAVEVERVSEGQRYLARTLGEQPAKPLSMAAGVEVKRS